MFSQKGNISRSGGLLSSFFIYSCRCASPVEGQPSGGDGSSRIARELLHTHLPAIRYREKQSQRENACDRDTGGGKRREEVRNKECGTDCSVVL